MPIFEDLLDLFNRDPDKRPPVTDILSGFVSSFIIDKTTKALHDSLEEEGLWDLECGAWDDNYDILGYLPPCPKCHHKMRYNDGADMLQCPECGYYIEGRDYPYRNMPSWDEITEDDYN